MSSKLSQRLGRAWGALRGKPALTYNDAAALATVMVRQMHGARGAKMGYDAYDSTIRGAKPAKEYSVPELVRKRLPRARALSWELYRNSGNYRGTVKTIIDNVIGTGLRVVPQARDAEQQLLADVNNELADAWSRYAERDNWDSTTKSDFVGEGQRFLLQHRIVSGNNFLQAVKNSQAYTGISWYTFNENYLDDSRDTYYMEDKRNTTTIWGIELNNLRAPVRYYLKGVQKPIPAAQVIHGYVPESVDMPIGVPLGISIINLDYDRHEISDSYRVKVHALANWIVKLSESGSFPNANDLDSNNVFEALRGTMPKTDTEFTDIKLPDNVQETMVPLMEMWETEESAGMGISRTSALKDLKGTTFAGATYAGVLDSTFYTPMRADFIADTCRPMYRKFVANYYMSGKSKYVSPVEFAMNQTRYTMHSWAHDAMPSVDRRKDATADQLSLQNGDLLLTDLLERRGTTLDEYLRKAAREYDALEALRAHKPGIQIGASILQEINNEEDKEHEVVSS